MIHPTLPDIRNLMYFNIDFIIKSMIFTQLLAMQEIY